MAAPLISGLVGLGITKTIPIMMAHKDDERIPMIVRSALSYLQTFYNTCIEKYPLLDKYISVALRDNLGLTTMSVVFLVSQSALNMSFGLKALYTIVFMVVPIGLHCLRQISYLFFPRLMRSYIMPSSVKYNPYFPKSFSLPHSDDHIETCYAETYFKGKYSGDIKTILEGTHEFYLDKKLPRPSLLDVQNQIDLVNAVFQTLEDPSIPNDFTNIVRGENNLPKVWERFFTSYLIKIIPHELVLECSENKEQLKLLLEVIMVEFQRLTTMPLDIKNILKRINLSSHIKKVQEQEIPKPDYSSILFENYVSNKFHFQKEAERDDFFDYEYSSSDWFILGIHSMLSLFFKDILERCNNGDVLEV